MSAIKPFRAWRYNPERIQDINRKFSPLFDVVSEKQLEELYNIPNNSIHLSVPRSHEAALDKWTEWKEAEIVLQDPRPSLYIYYQQFTLFGETRTFVRKGFIGMIQLEEEDIILHEDTITHSVKERVKLLELTQLNVAPTHGLYRDPEMELEQLMDRYMEQPLYEYIDYQGVINKLAIIDDPKDLEIIINKLATQRVYLADGHHRLASSFAYRDKVQQNGAWSTDSLANHHLMYLTNLDSDDLRILPTHRVYLPGQKLDLASIRDQLREWFDITDVSRSRKPLFDMLVDKPHAFGLVSLGRRWIIQLKEGLDPLKLVELDLPDPLKRLDYTLLHYLVFDKVLGIPYAEQNNSEHIQYSKDYFSAVSLVNKGKAELSFIANGVTMEHMLEVCETGHKMPQKSTYFYPKVVCGLVFGSIKHDET